MNTGSKKNEVFIPNRIIHEPVRLQIVAYLAAGGKQTPFTELRKKLSLTAGNLSVQLRKLEEAGYVSITKTFRDRKPLTSVSMTREGLKALQQYLVELEKIIEHLKSNTDPPVDKDDKEPN